MTQYHDRASGPPRLVDGPGCTPAVLPDDATVWQSLVYTGASDNPMDDLAGPDTNTRCESPRHTFGEFKPPAEWVEMLWHPYGDKTVDRCWKTCEACHVALSQVAGTDRDQPPPP